MTPRVKNTIYSINENVYIVNIIIDFETRAYMHIMVCWYIGIYFSLCYNKNRRDILMKNRSI